MRRDTLHVTLIFLGAVSEVRLPILVEAAGMVAAQAEPFEVILDRIGWWSYNHTLWLGCTSIPSRHHRLHDALVQALGSAGFPGEPRAYHPHLTLVRRAQCLSLPLLGPPVRWPAQAFSLVESRLQGGGARYRVLNRWPLQGGLQEK